MTNDRRRGGDFPPRRRLVVRFSFSHRDSHRKISLLFPCVMESMLTLAHLQQRRSRRWLFGLTLLLLVTLLISLCAGSNGSRPASGSAPKVSCLSGRSACREPAVLLVGAALALSGAIMQALFENLWRSRGCWGLQRRGRRADCRRPAGQRSLARLGARPVCHLWRAADHFILLRFARRHLSTSRLLLAGWRWGSSAAP